MWDLIRHLPEQSAWRRLAGVSSPLEENVATILDFLVHAVVTKYRQDTFDPEKWDEHKELARLVKRATSPPSPLPAVVPVAVRPRNWASLTADLVRVPEEPVEDVEGHEAHERLQQVLADQT